MVVESADLIEKLQQGPFTLSINVPIPDPYQKNIGDQSIKLSNYEVLDYSTYGFNSLSLYNFRIDEATLQQFVGSNFSIGIE